MIGPKQQSTSHHITDGSPLASSYLPYHDLMNTPSSTRQSGKRPSRASATASTSTHSTDIQSILSKKKKASSNHHPSAPRVPPSDVTIKQILSAHPYRDLRNKKQLKWLMRYECELADGIKRGMVYTSLLVAKDGEKLRDEFWKEMEKEGKVTEAQKAIIDAGRY
ncbi:hypothetical protein BD324DRAFT_619162 [Kockovaella imperatae]|uniref:Uncharacterized protein n=1 Tax=Kockovaella imperatae TaxID=4999 RepID=A0A1Y1UMK5_9TREE|nr:hypothetical protein BD324DRAFT_619162 [Kockovaella imperatae]ORX39293.1 hypothetical protein BD324DRAFT_619162 [Kockovaella imperatae]